ncbi:MAG: peptide chain release factor 2 [Armatimonadetes bacterium]|nr:peptide chain release factor 2 [Armatimonadota bacterium]MDE2205237.1 peptide chain release factor 2 [Armatimonadota bacterium]
MSLEGIFDVAGRLDTIATLETASSDPQLWDDPPAAQALLKQLSQLQESIAPVQALGRRVDDVEALCHLLQEAGEPDPESEAELAAALRELAHDLDRLEIEMLLGGPYDAGDAILEIQAGAGGTDACDWVVMLQQMYLRWCERKGFDAEVADESEADVAGLRSTTLFVRGRYAYGYLRAEHGVHRLVRISPFDAAKRRQTSFARVEVLPDVGEEAAVAINPDDLRIDYYRSSGAGGQHVNKTESAVRLTHLPTGLVVTCQNERSQHKNKAAAMKVLAARLWDRGQQEQKERERAMRGETKANEWGNQDRSYVLQPYTLVKDLRTNVETGDVTGVLNGNLDPFIQAWLQWQKSGSP